MSDPENTGSRSGLSRRRLLVGGVAGVTAAAMLAPLLPMPGPADQVLRGRAPDRDFVPAGPVLRRGQAGAPVRLEVYASLTCGHCREAHLNELPAVEDAFVGAGDLEVVYVHFPLDPAALLAARMVMCVPQGRRWPVLDMLYARQSDWAVPGDAEAELRRIVAQAGVTAQGLDACLAGDRGILDLQRRAAEALSIRATPTFRVTGAGGAQLLRGNVGADALRRAVRAQLG